MKKECPITKWLLYKNAIWPMVVTFIIFCAIVMGMYVVIILRFQELRNWLKEMLFALIMVVFMYFFIIGIGSMSALNGILRLFRQEISLKFSFSEEMRKYHIVSANYENNQWFILTKKVNVLVINRDYIQRIESIVEGQSIELVGEL